MLRKLTLLSTALLCASSANAAPDKLELPPYVQAYEPKSVDERGLWMEADQYEKALKLSDLLVNDENLVEYVRQILCDTVGADRCNGVRVYIADIPAFNATMSPNGMMVVWTGLLLRARSEAEVGAVLGHEFAHFERRHSLKGFQQRRKATNVLAWVQVLGGITQTDTRDVQTNLVGSLFQFDRAQEKEADLLGLQYLARSAYPSRAASEIWQHLMEEADATLYGRNLKKKHRYAAGFFDTHPTELDRADYLLNESLKVGDGGNAQSKRYYEKLTPYLPRLLKGQIRLNDLHGTDYIINGIATTTGWTGELLEARAEMYATRGEPRDLVTATTLYLNALEANHRTPGTLRGLGLSLVKSGRRSEGVSYLQEYLQAVPNAPDAALVQMYIPKSEKK